MLLRVVLTGTACYTFTSDKGHRYERSKDATRGAPGLTTSSKKLLGTRASLRVTKSIPTGDSMEQDKCLGRLERGNGRCEFH